METVSVLEDKLIKKDDDIQNLKKELTDNYV